MYSTDDWVAPVQPTLVDINDPIPTSDNPYPSDIDLMFPTISFFVHMKLVAFPKYHTNADNTDNDVGRKFFCDLQYIIDHGTFADQQKALVREAEQSWRKSVGSSGSISIQWSGRLQLDDCETYQCAFGPLIFISRDFCEWLEIPLSLSRKIQVGAEVEGNSASPSISPPEYGMRQINGKWIHLRGLL